MFSEFKSLSRFHLIPDKNQWFLYLGIRLDAVVNERMSTARWSDREF